MKKAQAKAAVQKAATTIALFEFGLNRRKVSQTEMPKKTVTTTANAAGLLKYRTGSRTASKASAVRIRVFSIGRGWLGCSAGWIGLGYLFAGTAETAFPGLVGRDGGVERLGREVGPVGI